MVSIEKKEDYMKRKGTIQSGEREAVRETKVFDGLTYEKTDGCTLDLIIFNSRNVSALPLAECMNFLFLQEDNKTFISVLFYSVENIWIAKFENPNNPFANMKRNKEGMLQEGD